MRKLITITLALIILLTTSNIEARQPNFVFIVSDDHRADVYGADGNQLANTPNLNRLATEGIRFTRAYCNSPVCSPSRQSFLTGRFPHSVGVTLLRHQMDDDAYTLAHRLTRAGYRTGAFGKMHFNNTKLYGFHVHKTLGNFIRQTDKIRTHRPLPDGVKVLPQWKPFRVPAREWLNAFYRPYGRYDQEMPASWYVEQAVKFMTENRDRPFFVQLGFHQPHSPFRFPVEFHQTYDPNLFLVPPIGPEDAPQIPKIFAPLTYREKQGIAASYYTAVAYLDKKIGQVLKAIDDLGLTNNTLIVYIGDHGYHLGEHGRIEKHCMFEKCVRSPLVIRFPGRIKPNTTSKALAEFVDIVPTVLDYLGLPVEPNAPAPKDLHGFSLRPIIQGKKEKVRDMVFSEYMPTQRAMACTQRYKLIYSTGKTTDWMGYDPLIEPTGREIRLYDMIKDPEEFHNIANQPANKKIVDELLDFLVDVYRRTPPMDEKIPDKKMSRQDFLDWAITPRNIPQPKK
ncbi:MAG: sulfatase family protein [Planctomycetota bacterium]|jgi:choline-sulfatase